MKCRSFIQIGNGIEWESINDVDGEMMSETETLETRVEHLEQLETKVQKVEAWVKTGFIAQGREVDTRMEGLQGLETRVQSLERNLTKQQDTDRTQYNLDKATLNGILEQLGAIHTKMKEQSEAQDLTMRRHKQRTDARTDALVARVAELEKPFYRRILGATTIVQPEADKSTLLQRMEAFNS